MARNQARAAGRQIRSTDAKLQPLQREAAKLAPLALAGPDIDPAGPTIAVYAATTAPPIIEPDASVIGTATNFAREDHTHGAEFVKRYSLLVGGW